MKHLFFGGIHPKYKKEMSTQVTDLETIVPQEVVIPMQQHIGAPCTPLVQVGQRVLRFQKIGDGAFSDCTSLRGITIPESVNVIGEEAFSGCTALEAISISGRIKEIREDAFEDCSYLGYIFFDGLHDEWIALYDEFINPYVGVICQDGSFYQGGELYE